MKCLLCFRINVYLMWDLPRLDCLIIKIAEAVWPFGFSAPALKLNTLLVAVTLFASASQPASSGTAVGRFKVIITDNGNQNNQHNKSG